MKPRKLSKGMFLAGLALSAIVGAYPAGDAVAAITCEREVIADVVVIDQPLMFNRLGAGNPNAMIYALRRDVIFSDSKLPLTVDGRVPDPGAQFFELRPDRRPRPLVLRVRQGDCLSVKLENLLKPENKDPEMTFFLKSKPVERFRGSQIARVNIGFKAIKVQGFKRILQERPQGIMHIP